MTSRTPLVPRSGPDPPALRAPQLHVVEMVPGASGSDDQARGAKRTDEEHRARANPHHQGARGVDQVCGSGAQRPAPSGGTQAAAAEEEKGEGEEREEGEEGEKGARGGFGEGPHVGAVERTDRVLGSSHFRLRAGVRPCVQPRCHRHLHLRHRQRPLGVVRHW